MKNRKGKLMAWAGLALALVLLTTAAARAAEKYEEKFSRTEPLDRDGRVYLGNISGDIEVTTWKENQVKIEAVKTARAGSLEKAKEDAAKVTIEVRQEAGTLRIEARYPRERGFWGGDSVNVSVDFKLVVPDGASVEVNSISGDVKMKELGGRAKVRSVSGDVEVRGAAGFEGDLVSGDVTLENIAGDVELKTVSGDVKAAVVKGSVTAESVSGDVEFDGVEEARSVSAKSVSGDIRYRGRIYEGGRYELRSHSGDVRLEIPADSAFEFEAKTFSGTVDSDFEIQVVGKLSPREIRGTVGSGKALIRISSFSGSIEIKKR